MNTRNTFIKGKLSPKLRKKYYLNMGTQLIMALIVFYDSIKHGTPLYYVGFYWLGLISGIIYRRLVQVELQESHEEINLKVSSWSILFTLLLLFFRFFFGIHMLEFAHVVYASDALSLFFIGLHRTKLKNIARQIDEIIYKWIGEK